MRCGAAVPESCYSRPHQCEKKHNLTVVKVGSSKVRICRHHKSVFESKGTLELWKSAAPFN